MRNRVKNLLSLIGGSISYKLLAQILAYNNQEIRMQKIFQILSPNSSNLSKKVSQFLKREKFYIKGPLVNDFDQSIQNSVSKMYEEKVFLQEMVKELNTLKDEGKIIKIFTIIHKMVEMRNYEKDVIISLENISMDTVKNSKMQLWFKEFCIAYSTYLMRLPTLSDIYSKLLCGSFSVSENSHLTQLFRLTNTISCLFPALTNAMNVVGRYHENALSEMNHLFRVISLELCRVYRYIKKLVVEIFSDYRSYKKSQLQCFIDSIPQISLACDKIEDFVLCKYFKGARIFDKCSFPEQHISEIGFYISQMKEEDQENSISTHQNTFSEQDESPMSNNKLLVSAAYQCSFGQGLSN